MALPLAKTIANQIIIYQAGWFKIGPISDFFSAVSQVRVSFWTVRQANAGVAERVSPGNNQGTLDHRTAGPLDRVGLRSSDHRRYERNLRREVVRLVPHAKVEMLWAEINESGFICRSVFATFSVE
jgi:hypothetical protein